MLDVQVKDIESYDLYKADEPFMTGSPFCMLPVVQLSGLPLGIDTVGKRI
jgi:branched-chain amino acid aminotransferase